MTFDEMSGAGAGGGIADAAGSEGSILPTVGPRLSATGSALLRAMDRLEFVVDVETRALETHHDIDLEESNRRKSQILLELSRLMKVVDQEPLESQVIDRLSSVRQKLARNQAVLELNLRAMNEVAEIVAASIRAEESDGTYQPSGHVRGPAR